MRRVIISCLLSWAALSAYGNDSLKALCAHTIHLENLQQHLNILASDDYEGRGSGQSGQKKAAAYIATQFKQFGLEPINPKTTPYLQSFDIGGKKGNRSDVYIKTGEFSKLRTQDFYIEGDFSISQLQTEVIWMGYGIDSPDYSDYKEIDVTGKVVMVLIEEPKLLDGRYLLSQTVERSIWSDPYEKIKTAKKKGAASILLVHPTEYDFIRFKNRSKTLRQVVRKKVAPQGTPPSKFGVFYLRLKVGGAVFRKSRKKFLKLIEKMADYNKSTAGTFKNNISIRVAKHSFSNITENVIGFLKGSDLANEVVVIGAHYDHLGVNRFIYNGADDNASGTSALLALAEAFSKAKREGKGPRRSMLFIAFSGEEKGLLGSYYYSMHPIIPLESTKVYINMDMIGRGKKNKKEQTMVYIVGDKAITKINEANAKTYTPDIKLSYRYNSKSDPEQLYYRSDHYNFSRFGVPFIYYTTGFHKDYHQPSDDVSWINFAALEKITHLVFHSAWDFANN